MKYGTYPKSSDFGDLPIEYKQSLFTKQPIDCLTENIIEMLKASMTKRLLDKNNDKSHHWNSDFDNLTFDRDQRLIERRQIDRINGDILFSSYNGSRIYV